MNDEGYNYRGYISQWFVSTSLFFWLKSTWRCSKSSCHDPSICGGQECFKTYSKFGHPALCRGRWIDGSWFSNGGHWVRKRKLRREHPKLRLMVYYPYYLLGFWKHTRWLFGISEPSTVASFWCQFYVNLVLVKWVNYSFRSFGIANDVGVDLDD